MTSTKFKAGDPFPKFTLPAVGGGSIKVGEPQGGNDWQMVVVYRGKHCPMCARYLAKLEQLQSKFFSLKVDILTVSGDSKEKAEHQVKEGHLTMPVAFDLSLDHMRELGLYISYPRSPEETDRPFPEPGLFIINDKGKAQVIDISNAPFARPELEMVLHGLEYIRDPEENYPIRGTFPS